MSTNLNRVLQPILIRLQHLESRLDQLEQRDTDTNTTTYSPWAAVSFGIGLYCTYYAFRK